MFVFLGHDLAKLLGKSSIRVKTLSDTNLVA